jgi:DNA-binding NtrC family response regulator
MAAEAPGSRRAVKPQAAVEKAYILVVDDDPDVRWITSENLREIGYLVTEADGGRTALAILERGDPCDLIIADLVMTGLTGVDTVRLARRIRPDLKVLFCSGYADMSRFEEDIGNATVLQKPFDLDTLTEAVHVALQRAAQGAADNVVQLRTS